jgi:hypothetical protein
MINSWIRISELKNYQLKPNDLLEVTDGVLRAFAFFIDGALVESTTEASLDALMDVSWWKFADPLPSFVTED